MEKQKPFTLFVPPRLSSSQVSAVKPQTAAGDNTYFKTVNKCTEVDVAVPFTMSSLSKSRENIDTDPALQKLSILPLLEQVANSGSCHYQEGVNDSDFENSEPMSRLYSKLYKEAEKLKKWKVSIEIELKQKENKLQENRKIIEAQRKAIQELQFENEKVSLKLEEEIQENKDLIKENNATRHLCNLLKETCARSAEKTNKYEYEREETRQVYVDLNNNIEKMILAFEELRVQAENARLEMHFKLKEDHEKIQDLEEEFKKEVNDKENQVSLLLMQSTEKENKMKDLTFLLEESRAKVNQLEEKTKLQDENLKELNEKKDHLTSELEDTKMSLERSTSTQKALEEDLQIATKKIYQLTEEKEAQMEEFNKDKTTHSFVVTELKATTCTLEELLRTEQQRLGKNEDQLKLLTVELQKKSCELEDMTKLKNNKEVELEELKKILAEDQKLLVDEKKQVEKLAEELQGKEQELIFLLQNREKEVHDLEVQLTVTKTSEQHYLKQIEELKIEREKEKLEKTELTASCNMLSLENKKLAQEARDMALELKKHQEDIINSKKQEERMLKQIENLEEKEMNLRDELESVRKEFIQQEDEVKCKLDKSEENCNNLRKQVENKSKCIEELHQENKTLKKKSSAENKQLNAYEIKVNKLELELGNAKQKFQETTDNYQKEIEEKKISEEKLLGEVEKAKATVDEAVKLQKETDLRCQHKIAEMVALMEKHKHQYDKIVEERDSELGLYKSREQEQSSAKAALEKLKMAKENTVILKDKKDKKIQTSLLESPKTTCQKLDSKTTCSQNKPQISLSMDSSKSKDNRDGPWTSAQNIISTRVTKEYTVKTPTKFNVCQRERKCIPTGGSNKKRKTVFEFDVNSDSSENTDLLSLVSEEESSNRLYDNNPPNSHLLVKTPKQHPSSLSTPASFMKIGSLKNMREDRWAAIAKIDRKRRLKEAEKLFA
ncbi:synaptonemal complex protein 1 [Acomys russatus]|uniref:synaptonemal complex protein 1 n=1 Tax=Acomys russatus TaxID=60746 RepID=UPI0021E27FE1|nr:synaptonemal complex protein 1 [Acomys russatus]